MSGSTERVGNQGVQNLQQGDFSVGDGAGLNPSRQRGSVGVLQELILHGLVT